MSSADVVMQGTNAIANAYQGMIGAAADKKRRRMQALIGTFDGITGAIDQIKEAKTKRDEEAEAKALADALAMGLQDGDPSKVYDTVGAISTKTAKGASAKASLMLKLFGEKQEADYKKATLDLQKDQLNAIKLDRAADNWRLTWQNFETNKDRDAERARREAESKAELTLKEQAAADKRVELTRKDRAGYDVGQISRLNADLFTDSFDREKSGGLGRADTFATRFVEQSKKFVESPEVEKAYAKTLQDLALLDRKDQAVKEQMRLREQEDARRNIDRYQANLKTAAEAEARNIKFAMQPGEAADPLKVMAAVQRLQDDPAFKRLATLPGYDPEVLLSQLQAIIMRELGGGKREESGQDAEARYDLLVKQAKTKFGIPLGTPLTPEAQKWVDEQSGKKAPVDSGTPSPQTGGSAEPEFITVNGKIVRNPKYTRPR